MDYSTYKNSIIILDQSAWQQVAFSLSNIDVYKFLSDNKIKAVATSDSAQELSYQAYNPTLFGGQYASTVTASELNSKQSYILSSSNGSLTFPSLDTGYNIDILNPFIYSIPRTLWDTSIVMEKLKRATRSQADVSNIYLCRILKEMNLNFFIFTNDQNQIKQIKIEGFKYLRPDQLFSWMCRENFIDPRKGGWNFKKRKEHNKQWTKPDVKFKDILDL
ncbi:MAG TPA: hypothetical protein VMR49_01385 [Candidatus Paceibacterota bacterium]|jgi:hypothetical protein|nr:hypothetical protein [Candidatus Paceibacterota bacterium]